MCPQKRLDRLGVGGCPLGFLIMGTSNYLFRVSRMEKENKGVSDELEKRRASEGQSEDSRGE